MSEQLNRGDAETPSGAVVNAEQLEAELKAVGGERVELHPTKAHLFYLVHAAQYTAAAVDCGQVGREVLQDFIRWCRAEVPFPAQMTRSLETARRIVDGVQTPGPGGGE